MHDPRTSRSNAGTRGVNGQRSTRSFLDAVRETQPSNALPASPSCDPRSLQETLELEAAEAGALAYYRGLQYLRSRSASPDPGLHALVTAAQFEEFAAALNRLRHPTGRGRPAITALNLREFGEIDAAQLAHTALAVLLAAASQEETVDHTTDILGPWIYAELLADRIAKLDNRIWSQMEESFGAKLSTVEPATRLNILEATLKILCRTPPCWTEGDQHQAALDILAIALRSFPDTLCRIDGECLIPYHNPQKRLALSPSAASALADCDEFRASQRPFFIPMIVPPTPWSVDTIEGGSPYLRLRYSLLGRRHSESSRLQSQLRTSPEIRDELQSSTPLFLSIANALQETAFKVNSPVLETARTWQGLLSLTRPNSYVVKEACAYREHNLHFPVFLDFRGRVYYRPSRLNPQGGDLARALLTFADAAPLENSEAYLCFLMYGASLFSTPAVDLTPLAATALGNAARTRLDKLDAKSVRIILESHEFRSIASRALLNATASDAGWLSEDDKKSWRRLAFLTEYGRYLREVEQSGRSRSQPHVTFATALPIALDASCSGIQHIALLFRDEHAAAAANCLGGLPRRDLYQDAADRLVADLTSMLEGPSGVDQGLAQQCLSSGLINRSLLKAVVMPGSYGQEAFGRRQVMRKYIEDQAADDAFAAADLANAAAFLAQRAFAAAVATLPSLRDALTYFRSVGNALATVGLPDVLWITPSNFVVVQRGVRRQVKKRESRLAFGVKMGARLAEECTDPKAHHYRLGVNVVHSLDAAHLTATVQRFRQVRPGAPIATVHDSFMVRPGDAPALKEAFRSTLAQLYQGDPLHNIHHQLLDLYSARGGDKQHFPLLPDRGSAGLIKRVQTAEHLLS